MANDNPYDSLFTAEQDAKFRNVLGKRWVWVDPETKKPHNSAKDYFWSVEDRRGGVPANGNMNAPEMDLVVVKYWRNKTHSSQLFDDKGGAIGTTENHDAASEHNSRGEMTVPGYRIVEIEKFLKQFIEDK